MLWLPFRAALSSADQIKLDNLEDCRDVLGFHQVVTLGKHKRVVEAFCQMYGIKVVHSPEHPASARAA